MWFIAIQEGERRCLSGAVWGRVMVEFSGGEELCPFSRVIGAEDMEIGLEFLIGSFGLSVGLRVVGSGESYIVIEEAWNTSCIFHVEGSRSLYVSGDST